MPNFKAFQIFLQCAVSPLGNIFFGLLFFAMSFCIGLWFCLYPDNWENSEAALSFGLFGPLFLAYFCFKAAWCEIWSRVKAAQEKN